MIIRIVINTCNWEKKETATTGVNFTTTVLLIVVLDVSPIKKSFKVCSLTGKLQSNPYGYSGSNAGMIDTFRDAPLLSYRR